MAPGRSSPRRAVGLVVLLSCVLLTQVAPSAGAERSVAVGGQSGDRFTPATIEIVAGDSVVWTNHGGWHNVNGDGFSNTVSDDSWTFRHTFTDPGTFGYVCDVHPNMRGTVVVSAAPAPPDPEPTATAAPEPTATAAPQPTPTATSAPRPTAAPEPTATAAPASSATSAPEATAAPEPTATDDGDTPSEPASPQPSEEARDTGDTATTSPGPTPAPTVALTAAPTDRARLAAGDAGEGGRGGALPVAVAAALLAAAGGAWFVRSRRP